MISVVEEFKSEKKMFDRIEDNKKILKCWSSFLIRYSYMAILNLDLTTV